MAGRFTVETVFKGTDNTSSVISTIERHAKAMERGLSGAADKTFGALRQVGSAMAYTGVAAVGAGLAFAQAIAPGADFDAAMSSVGAVSLMTRDQVADLEAKARELGKTTKYSATEVAGGMEMMGKAGFDNGQIIAGIGPILAAAAAEGADFGETTSIVSNVMKGMGLSMSETGRVADVLTLAGARTNSSISSLGESMAIVAPTARQLKVPLEDAVSAVAMLQDVGIDASTSGSAVATMLTNLSKPSKEVAAKMKAMGVSFQDAHGDMLPFKDVIGQLAKAGKHAGGNMAQVAFFADLVGLRGQKAALNLKDLTGPMAKLRSELGSAAGSAERMGALKLDNFKGDMTKLSNLATDVGIDFFDLVKGPLRDAAQGTRAWLADNQDLIRSDVAGWIRGITDNIGPMRENIEKGVVLLVNFKNGLRAAFTDAQPAIDAVGGAIGSIFGGGDDSDGPLKQAYGYGKTIGDVAVRLGEFWLMTKAVSAATAVWSFITGAAKVAMIAIDGVVWAAKTAWFWYNIQLDAGIASTVAIAGANVIAQGSLMATRVAAFAAAGGFQALAGAIGVAGVAYLAYQAVKEQNDALKNETGGKGFFDVIGEAAPTWLGGGGKDFKSIADENLDKQAKKEAADREAKSKSAQDSRSSGAPGIEEWAKSQSGAADGLLKQLAAVNALSGQAPTVGVMPPMPTVAPQLAPRRDDGAIEQIQTNRQLQATVQQLNSKLGATSGKLVITLPKGATGELSGAPGVEVLQSGGF